MRRIGLGYRHALGRWIDENASLIDCLEITAEHFFDSGIRRLKELSRRFPLYVHGLGLSLGTPGNLDPETLASFTQVATTANAEWVSEHVAFTKSAEVDLGHLNPISPTSDTLELFVEHARELAERTARQVILENITTHLRVSGEMSETEFLNRLCEQSGCGLLLDVTNLYINSKNHGFNAVNWLHELAPEKIVQLHIVGYTYHNGQWHDHHSQPVQDDLLELTATVCEYAPVKAIILERDLNLEAVDEIAADFEKLRDTCGS